MDTMYTITELAASAPFQASPVALNDNGTPFKLLAG